MALKSLETLIKLQKTYVDEQRLQVAALQDRVDQIDAEVARLLIRKARESTAAKSDEARATYGAYIKNLVTQERTLDKERQAAVMAVKTAQDRLAALFEEQKRYEIARQQRQDAINREEKRRDGLDLDESGGVSHQRKK